MKQPTAMMALHDDEARRMLMRNNRTSPYLWGFAMLTVVPAVIFWHNTPVLMAFCLLFIISYVYAYVSIVRFKVARELYPQFHFVMMQKTKQHGWRRIH